MINNIAMTAIIEVLVIVGLYFFGYIKAYFP